MKPFSVCPNCGNPSFDVDYETVKHFIESSIGDNSKWGLCSNPSCDAVYHSSNNIVYYKKNLSIPIWFKSIEKSVPICYCSDITREEIENSVRDGSKTIDDVQNSTKKNITGNCKIMNPTGRCCRNAFLYTIKTVIDKNCFVSQEEGKKCCCGNDRPSPNKA